MAQTVLTVVCKSAFLALMISLCRGLHFHIETLCRDGYFRRKSITEGWMLDIFYLALGSGLFFAGAVYVRFCDKV
jgi:hypothetical protein